MHDRRLMRDAQITLVICWFAGHGMAEALPEHFALTRIRQNWGSARFRPIFARVVGDCLGAGILSGDVVHIRHRAPEDRRDTQPDQVAAGVSELRRPRDTTGLCIQQVDDVCQQRLAGLSQLHRPRGSREKLVPQFGFQLRDAIGQGRLRPGTV